MNIAFSEERKAELQAELERLGLATTDVDGIDAAAILIHAEDEADAVTCLCLAVADTDTHPIENPDYLANLRALSPNPDLQDFWQAIL
jgi:hypothetical protein